MRDENFSIKSSAFSISTLSLSLALPVQIPVLRLPQAAPTPTPTPTPTRPPTTNALTSASALASDADDASVEPGPPLPMSDVRRLPRARSGDDSTVESLGLLRRTLRCHVAASAFLAPRRHLGSTPPRSDEAKPSSSTLSHRRSLARSVSAPTQLSFAGVAEIRGSHFDLIQPRSSIAFVGQGS
ncbi:uncharacterized protein LOC130138810 [Syzygium oleosum]|uniref:uncharacterized protein LOC130138810 n=1 Tax=Syzygium oleosum TaxID=219896 RepID=UPI0024B91976|nr:uncharacterized protein LOC130138810 [Syzygium oleosum]